MKGVVYIATGTEYIREANESAASLKKHSSELHTTLFTDHEVTSKYFDDTKLIENPDHDFGDSILKPSMTPYDRTLFLDTDTYVCGDVSDVFDLLDRFDIAAAHNPGSRTPEEVPGYDEQQLPDAFPLYNTGVIAYRDTDEVNEFFEDWEETYFRTKTATGLNQPAFRETLYRSDLSIATLPSEYNLRIRYDGSVGFMADEVKVVHGRHPAGLSSVAERLNGEVGMRVFTMKNWPIEIVTKSPGIRYYVPTLLTEGNQPYTFRSRAINSFRNRGVVDTLTRILRDIRNMI